jgi:hypothetical protein
MIMAASLADLRTHIANLSESARRRYDSYALSPAYYAFTARLGGSVVRSNGALTVSCRHPNRSGVQLIFPELSEAPTYATGLRIARKAVREGLVPHFVRLTGDHRAGLFLAARSLTRQGLQLMDFEEDILDWRFPIHVLDTSLVACRRGGRFKRLRLQLRKVQRGRLSVLEYRHEAHAVAADKLLKAWSAQYRHPQYSTDQIVLPIWKLLQIRPDQVKTLRRQLLCLDGEVCGVSVWEEPVYQDGPANLLAVASTHSVSGISEWQMALLCEQLIARGITRLNIGGSETEGLDRYKRKFRPPESRDLYSAAVVPMVARQPTAYPVAQRENLLQHSPQAPSSSLIKLRA